MHSESSTASTSAAPTPREAFEVRIRPRRALSGLDLAEVWSYRDLVRMLVRRDFATRYRQTVLGPAWLVLQPLLVSGVFTLVFSVFARLPTGGAPPGLFYFAGLVAWNYVSQTFLTVSQLYVVQGHLFGKIYFPRLCLPLSTAIGNLFGFLVQAAAATLLVAGFAWVRPGSAAGIDPWLAGWFWLPVMLLQMGMAAVGLGLAVAALTVKYRDLAHLAGFLAQVWLYLTPVIYPLSSVPPGWRPWLAVNPASVPVDTIRAMWLGGASASPAEMAVGFGVAAVMLVGGIWFFRQTERSAVDTL